MPIERVNPKDIYAPFQDMYTQAIRTTGRTQVFLAGMVAVDPQWNLVGEGDVVTQVRVTMENIVKALAAVQAKPSDVVRINIFTVDVDKYLQQGHAVLLSFFEKGKLPVSTAVGVSRLADPRMLVEIEVTAVLD
ncbi:Rid family hydrolase [Hyalangium sp.]|uniref:Rid family hydrolase n=1 Tax=Hyalangium sp. TaxID=2028555 RepID=UPI002D5B3AAB|nr:Rid family hydrolase [Hyalangium sp.]HYH94942.1 Rid family hydrolase [Hyalangium sp.]